MQTVDYNFSSNDIFGNIFYEICDKFECVCRQSLIFQTMTSCSVDSNDVSLHVSYCEKNVSIYLAE